MQNKCLYLRLRKKQGRPYLYCTKKRAIIEFSSCNGCINKEYKKVAKNTLKTNSRLIAKKPINKVSKTNKVAKATAIPKKVKLIVWERDDHKCIFCGTPVVWNFANSHYIKRSHLGLGIEQNIITNCAKCHELFEHEPTRSEMIPFAKNYLMSKYDNWNEDILIYKKRGI